MPTMPDRAETEAPERPQPRERIETALAEITPLLRRLRLVEGLLKAGQPVHPAWCGHEITNGGQRRAAGTIARVSTRPSTRSVGGTPITLARVGAMSTTRARSPKRAARNQGP